jgi:hypothetical protein
MNIEALACEAGFAINEFGDIGDGYWSFDECAKKFAALVRAQALEEAARAADQMASHSLPNSVYLSQKCAAAIRALAKPPA